jgi:DNA polymerase-3 subunit alpha
MVAYQTAYLKANYPVEFLAASMTLDQHDTDKLNVFRQELARQNISLAPPDVQKSGPIFTVETDAEGKQTVRYALAALKGVGGAAMESLASVRAEGGPFKSLGDFARRIDAKSINKRVLESLAQAGAFDSLHPNRAAVHGLVEQMVQLASGAAAERDSNQVNLFGGESMPDLTPKEIRDWPLHDRLQKEFDSVGFYLTAHPLDDYKLAMDRLGVVRQNQLAAKLAGGPTRVKMAGTITARQERTSKKGNRFCFLGLTDATGAYEVMVFSELLPVVRELADAGKPVLVTADARMEGEGLRMTAAAIAPLDEAAQGAAAGLRIFLRDASPIASLRQIFYDEGPQLKGKGLVSLLVDVDDKEVEIHLPNRYAVSPSLRQRVKTVPGVVDVQEV